MDGKTKRKPTRARTRPQQAPGRVARALWGRVAELRAEGRNGSEIAEAIGRDRSSVARTLQEPEVIADIERIQTERRGALEQEIRAAAAEAWQTLRTSLAATKEEVQLRAACEILDRAGIVARKGVELSGPGGGPVAVAVDVRQLATMSPDQLRALAQVQEDVPPDVDSAADHPAEDTDP